jgi:hypothetical protein
VARLRSLRKRARAVSTYFAERREADRFQPEGWETEEGRALLSQYRAEMNGKMPAADLTRETTGPVPPGPMLAGPMSTGPVPGGLPPAGPMPADPARAGRGVARVPHGMANDVPRHCCDEATHGRSPAGARHSAKAVAPDTNHRPRHDGTQSQVDSSYLLTRPAATRHGTRCAAQTTAQAETARVLTITNVVRGPDGDPLAGAIVTITLVADHDMPGFQPDATIDGVARIVTAEESIWSAKEAAGARVVPVNTHYKIAEVTGRWPDGRVLARTSARPDEPAA